MVGPGPHVDQSQLSGPDPLSERASIRVIFNLMTDAAASGLKTAKLLEELAAHVNRQEERIAALESIVAKLTNSER